MVAVIIPLKPQPSVFRVFLNGINYQFTTRWNIPGNYWVLNIADQYGDKLICGIPLITGLNLIEQYQYIIQGGLWIISTENVYFDPTYTNLGITNNLYYTTT
jgi:hypothetical protein